MLEMHKTAGKMSIPSKPKYMRNREEPEPKPALPAPRRLNHGKYWIVNEGGQYTLVVKLEHWDWAHVAQRYDKRRVEKISNRKAVMRLLHDHYPNTTFGGEFRSRNAVPTNVWEWREVTRTPLPLKPPAA